MFKPQIDDKMWAIVNYALSILIAIFAITHIGVGAGFWGKDRSLGMNESSYKMFYIGFVELILALTFLPPLSKWVIEHTKKHGFLALVILNISCLIALVYS